MAIYRRGIGFEHEHRKGEIFRRSLTPAEAAIFLDTTESRVRRLVKERFVEWEEIPRKTHDFAGVEIRIDISSLVEVKKRLGAIFEDWRIKDIYGETSASTGHFEGFREDDDYDSLDGLDKVLDDESDGYSDEGSGEEVYEEAGQEAGDTAGYPAVMEGELEGGPQKSGEPDTAGSGGTEPQVIFISRGAITGVDSLSEDFPIEKYKGLKLDDFQKKSIGIIEQGISLLVSAPTGVGKTLIADYLVEKAVKEGKCVAYTAPIKALSSQKYKDFCRDLGEDNVGILTGDIVINPEAPLLVMTTEVLRNMLFGDEDRLARLSWVIFDEIHYIGDIDRGHVWEECIILLSKHIKFLGLSATIPNAVDLARWMSDVRSSPFAVVRHFKRAVPLKHLVFESSCGFCTPKRLGQRYRALEKRASGDGRWGYHAIPQTDFLDLVAALIPKRHMPCLYFVFSRKRCQEYADIIAKNLSYLTSKESEEAMRRLDEVVKRHGIKETPNVIALRDTLPRGVAFHHAGLLPVLKDLVEELLRDRLVQLLFATETFAVGVNYPVKTVVFDSPTKYDGYSFRDLTNQEYFQLAGRAGRRGIDEKGNVITVVNFKYTAPWDLPDFNEARIEPLAGKFGLSYNSVLNLIDTFDRERIERIIRSNFGTYTNRERLESFETRLTELDKGIAFLESRGCSLHGEPACPRVYRRIAQKIHEREAEIDRLVRHRGKRAKARIDALNMSLEDLKRRIEGINPGKCDYRLKKKCGYWSRRLKRSRREREELLEEYRRLSPPSLYLEEFERKRAFLETLDFIQGDRLLSRGRLAKEIYVQEILVTELVAEGIFHELDEDQINSLAVCIDCEPRTRPMEGQLRKRRFDHAATLAIVRRLEEAEERSLGRVTVRFADDLAEAALKWSRGMDFLKLVEESDEDEGTIVLAFRRAIDLLRQIRNAVRGDKALTEKLSKAMDKLDRDIVTTVL